MTTYDLQGRLSQLFVYPIKSCAGIALPQARLTETGLELDRAFMLVDAQGQFLTQRELPRMALVQPQLRPSELVLRAPGMLALHLRLEVVEAPATVRIWDETVPAWDMGPLAAQWFSDFLGQHCRLVRFDPDFQRASSLRWTQGATALNQFSDGYPILVLGQGSLDGLNQRLQAAGQAPVGIERFRPNLVIAGWEPHDEDRTALLHIEGGIALRAVKPCPRCPIPDIDPATATSSPHVSTALRAYRSDARVEGAITFGMNAITVQGMGHSLRVGQAVGADLCFD